MTTPFRFADFRSIAEKLSADRNEASLRCAVSRIYYSVFHLGLELTRVTYPDPDKGIHRTVIHRLRLWGPDLKDKLDSLRRLRVAADYRLSHEFEDDDELRSISSDWQRNWRRALLIGSVLQPELEKHLSRRKKS